NDDVDDDNQGYTIVTTATSSDAKYDNIAVLDVTGTTTDDDVAGITVTPTTGLTTSEAGGSDQFTVVLDSEPTDDVTVGISSSDTGEGTVSPSTLTFTSADWDTPQPVTVMGQPDTLDDDDQGYTVQTAAASSSDPKYSGMPVDDVSVTNTDIDASMISINDVSRAEGNSGSANLTFAVTLSVPSTQTVTVDYTLGGGTATAGTDYTATPGTVTFTPGDTSEPIDVPILGDAVDELNETFNVTLSSPSNAAISDGLGVGTITDDDDPPTISIGDVSVTETDAGTPTATFTVSLSGPSSFQVQVNYATGGGNATAGTDYQSASGAVTFTAGDTSEPIDVTVNGDTTDEIDETFNVTLSSPSNGTIADGTGVGTITDDDDPPTVSIDDVTVGEGDGGQTNAQFTVSLSAASGKTVTVDYATSNGTATAGSDYQSATGAVTFTPGDTSEPVSITVNGDFVDEGASETFDLTLSNPSNVTIGDGGGVGTITDDDVAGITVTPTGGLTTTEAGGTDTFTVVLDSEPTATVTIGLSSSNTNEGTVSPSSLSFTASDWDSPQTVTVTGVDDLVVDGNVLYAIYTAVASSSDPTYNGINADDVNVSNLDND
ncbi:MAG: Calx-beta domain-containing protein, partial [Gemmatimonadota bacterium]